MAARIQDLTRDFLCKDLGYPAYTHKVIDLMEGADDYTAGFFHGYWKLATAIRAEADNGSYSIGKDELAAK